MPDSPSRSFTRLIHILHIKGYHHRNKSRRDCPLRTSHEPSALCFSSSVSALAESPRARSAAPPTIRFRLFPVSGPVQACRRKNMSDSPTRGGKLKAPRAPQFRGLDFHLGPHSKFSRLAKQNAHPTPTPTPPHPHPAMALLPTVTGPLFT